MAYGSKQEEVPKGTPRGGLNWETRSRLWPLGWCGKEHQSSLLWRTEPSEFSKDSCSAWETCVFPDPAVTAAGQIRTP